MADGDPGNDDEEFRSPLPPEDRLWRHPSELAAEAAAPSAPQRRAWRPLVGALAGGLCVVGALWLLTGGNASDAPTVAAAADETEPGADDQESGGASHDGTPTDGDSDPETGSESADGVYEPSPAPFDDGHGPDPSVDTTTTLVASTTTVVTDTSEPPDDTSDPGEDEAEPPHTDPGEDGDQPEAPGDGTAWLGVTLRDPDDGAGVMVTEIVPGGPAHHAGIEVDDRIIDVDGVPVSTADAAVATLHEHDPGAEVSVRLHRDGEESTVIVALGARPEH